MTALNKDGLEAAYDALRSGRFHPEDEMDVVTTVVEAYLSAPLPALPALDEKVVAAGVDVLMFLDPQMAESTARVTMRRILRALPPAPSAVSASDIERGAEAAWEFRRQRAMNGTPPAWAECRDGLRDEYRDLVRVVLSALRTAPAPPAVVPDVTEGDIARFALNESEWIYKRRANGWSEADILSATQERAKSLRTPPSDRCPECGFPSAAHKLCADGTVSVSDGEGFSTFCTHHLTAPTPPAVVPEVSKDTVDYYRESAAQNVGAFMERYITEAFAAVEYVRSLRTAPPAVVAEVREEERIWNDAVDSRDHSAADAALEDM